MRPAPLHRRQFLGSALGAGAGVPALWRRVASCKEPGAGTPLLLVLELTGGHDGPSAVVPFRDDHYYRQRPTLAIPAKRVLALDDTRGFHPHLGPFRELWEQGSLALVESVGVPYPSRSHFQAKEMWHTASDGRAKGDYGWIGSLADHLFAGARAETVVALAGQPPQSVLARAFHGLTFNEPDQFRLLCAGFTPGGAGPADAFFRALNGLAREPEPAAGAAPLEFLRRTTAEALRSLHAIEGARHQRLVGDYGHGPLADELRMVARMIGAGFPTRVFHVQHGNYDTHTAQLATQEALYPELAAALRGFVADLRALGRWNDIVVMTTSEFGRRVAENASGGTDHGVAAPMFLLGGKIKGGLHGQPPSYAPDSLVSGDLATHLDYRTLYATVLAHHLGAPAEEILGGEFGRVGVV